MLSFGNSLSFILDNSLEASFPLARPLFSIALNFPALLPWPLSGSSALLFWCEPCVPVDRVSNLGLIFDAEHKPKIEATCSKDQDPGRVLACGAPKE